MTPEERLMAAEVERGRLHRLEPSQPLKDAADAAAFVTQGIHTERGSHTTALRPWSESQIARRCQPTDGLPDLETSMDLVVETAVRAAVVVSERQARKWFDFAAERIDVLVDAGRIDRLIPAPRERWLLAGRAR